MEERGGHFMVADHLKHVSITLNEVLNRGYRLEASVFNTDAKNANEVLNRCKWKIETLCGANGLAKGYHRGIFKRIFLPKSELAIYQPSQITEIYPKPELYISEKTPTDINALRVRKGQILMTCSGTVGKCTIVTDFLDSKIFSHDLLRITAHRVEDTGYIYAYLKSEIGQILIKNNNYGSVIQHIEPEHLSEILIPNPPNEIKDSIHNIVMESFNLRDRSNNLIDQAEQLLINELNLPPLDEIKPDYFDNSIEVKTYSVPLNNLAERLDASYHIPMADKILDYLFDYADSITTLFDKEICKAVFLPGRFKRIYVEETEGMTFFGGKQIQELDPSNKKYLSLFQHGNRINNELLLIENMILTTRSGTVGKVNIVPKHWENWVANDHIIRITPANENIAGYLYIWLNTDYGRILIERFIYGSVVDEVDSNHISQVQIPILKDKAKQKEINDLALQANNLRSQAYFKEQEAVKMIDELVLYAEK